MKKLTLLAALFTLYTCIGIIQGGVAQTDDRENFKFGLKVGVNYSNVYDEEGQEFTADPKLGMAAGAFCAIPIGQFLGFQPEILFSQKGFQGSGTLLGSPYRFTRKTSFIDVPLQLALKPSRFITLLGGVQYCYLLRQRDEFESSLMSVVQEQEFENDNIRKNIFGFVGGFDIHLNSFVLGGRLAWDATNNKGDGTSTTPRYKNVWYQLTVGFRFF